MCAKGVIFGGFGREKGGQKGVFGASEAGKRRFFACRRGDWRVQRGFRVRIGHYVSANARPKSTPGTMIQVRKLRVRTYESLAPSARERARSFSVACPVRTEMSSDHGGDNGFAQEPRRFFGRRGVDIHAGAPLEPGDLGKLRHDLEMPVVVVVVGFGQG